MSKNQIFSGKIRIAQDENLETGVLTEDASEIANTTCDINEKNEGTAFNNSVVGNAGVVNIYNLGIVTGLTINGGGTVNVYSSGIASNTQINKSGELFLSNGGTAIGTTVNSNGSLYISKGGVADKTTVEGGLVKVLKGGTAGVSNGGTTVGTTVNSAGSLKIMSGAVAYNTLINASGTAIVSSGASASYVNIKDDGEFYISGTAENIYIANGGYAVVGKGAVASNSEIEGDGIFIISSGAKHQGTLDIREGAVVSAYRGSTIDFTLADRTNSPAEYLINDVSKIQGNPNFTITIPYEDMKGGIYVLSQDGADYFNSSIDVYSARVIDSVNTVYTHTGTLTMATPVTIDNMTYCLKKDDGCLSLYVKDSKFLQAEVGNFINGGGVFELSEEGIGTLYSRNKEYVLSGAIDTGTWELVGVGDFDGDGVDGLLWLDKEAGTVYAQNDMTNFDEVNDRTNLVGIVEEDYSIIGTGDFANTGYDGTLLKGPAFGDASISTNYGLPVWARDGEGYTFNGWLGALVNTWDTDDELKGNTKDLDEINALNYRFDLIATGDFNGDGVEDVLLQNTMPETVNGVEITGSGDVFAFLTGSSEDIKNGADPTVAYTGCATDGWNVLDTGDFNGDGTDDILVSNGVTVCGWIIENGVRTGDFTLGDLKDGETVLGVVDFDRNGTSDVVIYDAETKTKNIWYVNDALVSSTGMIAIA